MGRLTTHVLDTARGVPAADLTIELWRIDGGGPGRNGGDRRVKVVATNTDGRVEGAILDGDDLTAGVYELRFRAADYLRACGVKLPDPPFLDVIPIRFGIAEPGRHYHVPLLLSPFGYSTYRGS